MKYGSKVQGHVQVATQATAACIAAPGAGVRLAITKGVVSVSVFAASAKVALDDGTTTFWIIDAVADENGGHFPFDFGDDGYSLTANKGLFLTVSGGNATADAWFVGYSR